MQQIYTNENRLLAMHSKNLLENAGIVVEIRNEHTSGSAVPGHQIWLELWVNDADYATAVTLLKSFENDDTKNWNCAKCSEENSGAFQICWNCQGERS